MVERAADRRRKLVRLLRRCGVVLSVLLILAAVLLVNDATVSVQVTNGASHELINGQSNSNSLLLAFGLFVAGIAGLALCLR